MEVELTTNLSLDCDINEEKNISLNISGDVIKISENVAKQIPFIQVLMETNPDFNLIEINSLNANFIKYINDFIENERQLQYLKTNLSKEFNDSEIIKHLQYLGMDNLLNELYPLSKKIIKLMNYVKVEDDKMNNMFIKKFAMLICNEYKDIIIYRQRDYWYIFKNHRWYCNKEIFKDLIEDKILKKYKFLINNETIISAFNKKYFFSNLQNKIIYNFKENTSSHKIYDLLSNLNKKLNLIGFDNGVYELDNHKFRDGLADDYITMSTGYNYVSTYSDNKNELLSFLKSIQPIETLRELLIRQISECLLGKSYKCKTLIFVGMFEVIYFFTKLIKCTFGDYYGSFSPSMLSTRKYNRKNRREYHLDQDAFNLINFVHKRFMSCEWDNFNEEKLKLSNCRMLVDSSKTLKGKELYDDVIYFSPTYKIAINCEKLPSFYDSTKNNDMNDICIVEFPYNENIKMESNEYSKIDSKISSFKNDFLLLLLNVDKQKF